MDYSELDAAIDAQLRHDVADLFARAGGDLVAIAVLLVDDITGFGTVALTSDAAAKAKPTKRYRWWTPGEWKLFAADMPTDAGQVTSALWALTGTASAQGEVDEDTYEEIRGEYEDRLVAGLARLRAEGLLRDGRGRDVWAWVHYEDDYDDSVDLRTFRQLNDAAIATEFEHRFEDVRTGSATGALDEVVLSLLANRS